jgi:hypothetical protein
VTVKVGVPPGGIGDIAAVSDDKETMVSRSLGSEAPEMSVVLARQPKRPAANAAPATDDFANLPGGATREA